MENIIVEGPSLGKSSLCEPILHSLPQWFGLEAANQNYLKDIEVMPTLIAIFKGNVVGFLALKWHNEYTEEIYIMGVRHDLHRKGIGTTLPNSAEEYLKQKRIEYLQVKTLSSKHPDLNYAKTRAFYLSVGFRPLEEFNRLRDEQNPALIMIKRL